MLRAPFAGGIPVWTQLPALHCWNDQSFLCVDAGLAQAGLSACSCCIEEFGFLQILHI